MTIIEDTDGAPDAAMAALASILEQLWLAPPEKPCSLARLCKRTGRRMSVLMRQLTFMEGAGWVALALREDGGGSAQLTAPGRQLCAQLFGAGTAPSSLLKPG